LDNITVSKEPREHFGLAQQAHTGDIVLADMRSEHPITP